MPCLKHKGQSSCVCRYDELSTEDAEWLEGLFEGAQQAIKLAAARLNAYIAAKVSGCTQIVGK